VENAVNNTAARIEDLAGATDEELARGGEGVDVSWYLATYPDVARAGVDPVAHYLQFGWREKRDPRPDFSTAGYLTLNDEVARSAQNPLVHFLRKGRGNDEGAASQWHRLWNKGFLYPKLGEEPPIATQPFGAPGRQKILFVGHEATRTGAPLILLALMEAIERDTGAQLFLVLERDGPLVESYRRVAHVLINGHARLCELSMGQLLDQIAGPAPELAICNCAETWRLLSKLREASLPYIIALIHERMSRYPAEIANILRRDANRVIFPAHAVKRAATAAYPQFGDSDVVPQGLLKDEFGFGDKTAARRAVRDELRVGADTRLVLGCGVREPRKGLDLFVQLAARVRSKAIVPVHFLWLGGDAQPTEFKYFVEHDIALLDLGATVTLLPQTPDPERYFLAADVFTLPSRDDPFPCVVHEAMACAVPVVGFSGAGGASEALADGCGVIVPYLDLDAMAQQVCAVIEQPADFAVLGSKAEQRVRSQYRFAEYARRILAISAELRPDRDGATGLNALAGAVLSWIAAASPRHAQACAEHQRLGCKVE
jgi:glycosyltransferase involved in cell wall biosynthesis